MKAFLKLFENELDHYLNYQNYFDPKSTGYKLKRQLYSTSSLKKLQTHLSKPSEHPYRTIRILAVSHVLVRNSSQYYQFIENNLKIKPTSDKWLDEKLINPYYKFLMKICSSKDIYTGLINEGNDSKRSMQSLLKLLFYAINMIKSLFVVVQKLPLFGRYYLNKYGNLFHSTVELIALQVKDLYDALKNLLTELLVKGRTFVKTVQNKIIMKDILLNEIQKMNEFMTSLFMDKYFKPYKKGIIVKMFRLQNQQGQIMKSIKQILQNDQLKLKKLRKEQLQKKLFPQNGQVDWKFYQTNIKYHSFSHKTNRCEGLQQIIYLQSKEKKKSANLSVEQLKTKNELEQIQNKDTCDQLDCQYYLE